MTTFGLVHGGCHGAWQWGPLVSELDALGHRSLSVDLPISDPTLGVTDYAASAAAAFEGAPDLVVVGPLTRRLCHTIRGGAHRGSHAGLPGRRNTRGGISRSPSGIVDAAHPA